MPHSTNWIEHPPNDPPPHQLQTVDAEPHIHVKIQYTGTVVMKQDDRETTLNLKDHALQQYLANTELPAISDAQHIEKTLSVKKNCQCVQQL